MDVDKGHGGARKEAAISGGTGDAQRWFQFSWSTVSNDVQELIVEGRGGLIGVDGGLVVEHRQQRARGGSARTTTN